MALKNILGVLLYLSIGFGIAIATIRLFCSEEDNSGLDDLLDDIAPVVVLFLWPLAVAALALAEVHLALEDLFRRIREKTREERKNKEESD